MIQRILLTAYRASVKNRLFFLINLLGLVIAMMAVMVIVQYILFETDFESFHKNPDDIYRVSMELHTSGDISAVSATYGATGEAMLETFPEVASFVTTSLDNKEYGFVGTERLGEMQTIRVGGAYFTTPGFFDVFDFPILSGNAESPLTNINDMVISESLGKKLFGDTDPVGQKIFWFTSDRGRSSFQVSAVVKDVPSNSHFQFELLMPMDILYNNYPSLHDDKWAAYGFYNYIKLRPGSQEEHLQAQLEEFISSNLGRNYDDPVHTRLFLQGIPSIHLRSNLLYEPTVNGDIDTLRLLGITTILLVVLAYANYINLFASVAVTRAKEVGIKKVLGSSVRQLMLQFQTETILTNFLAFALATVLLLGVKEKLSLIFEGYPDFTLYQSPHFWVLGGGLVLILSLLSGLYPAMMLSSEKSMAMLRGTFANSRKGVRLRRNMVIFQFVIASGLIVFTLVVNNQFQFMLNQETGTAIDQVLVLKRPLNVNSGFASQYRAFKYELLRTSLVSEASISSSIPGSLTWGTGGVRRVSDPPEAGKLMTRIHVDEHYTNVYDLKLKHGRMFSEDFQADETSILLTMKAAQLVNPANPEKLIGEHLIFYGDTSRVVGLIDNYYHHSLKKEYQPLGLKLVSDGMNFISLKINSDNLAQVLSSIESAWQSHFPGNPLDFFFLDDHFNRSYQQEQNLSRIIKVFAALAIIIACLGLFGLSSFMLQRRVKEIGIRKVLGAQVADLFWTLSSNIFRWVLMAYILAIPMAIYFSANWLEAFPNRMSWHWFIPVFPLVLMMFFTMIAIVYNVIKAVYLNPVKTLRTE